MRLGRDGRAARRPAESAGVTLGQFGQGHLARGQSSQQFRQRRQEHQGIRVLRGQRRAQTRPRPDHDDIRVVGRRVAREIRYTLVPRPFDTSFTPVVFETCKGDRNGVYTSNSIPYRLLSNEISINRLKEST